MIKKKPNVHKETITALAAAIDGHTAVRRHSVDARELPQDGREKDSKHAGLRLIRAKG